MYAGYRNIVGLELLWMIHWVTLKFVDYAARIHRKNTVHRLTDIEQNTQTCVAMEIATKDTAELQNRNRDSAPVTKFKVTPKPIKKKRQKKAKYLRCGREVHE